MICRMCGWVGAPSELLPLVLPMERCGGCLGWQCEHLPSDETLATFYQGAWIEDYSAGMPPERYTREMPRRWQAKLDLIKATSPSRSLLDVGVGDGMFLGMAHRQGYRTAGTDFAVKEAYPEGLAVIQASLDGEGGLPFPDASQDNVTLWAVIEHLKHPGKALGEIRRVLKPGGYFFLDTPLVGDPCERLAAARSHWISPPEHLHIFSHAGLKAALRQQGFLIVKGYPSFERSLARYVARRGRNILIGQILGGLRRGLQPQAWAQARATRATGIGDIQLIVARKPELA